MVSERCTRCGLPQVEWKDEGGLGFILNGRAFCCRNCAEGRGCTCK
jgi:hypothetical protein